MSSGKKFLFEAYFNGLLARKNSCDSIREQGHSDESFTLICCYIDAIASQYYSEGSQAKRFSMALMHLSGDEFFKQIHPRHALNKISEKPCFSPVLPEVQSLLEPMVGQFYPIEDVSSKLLALALNSVQKKWVEDNLYKGSVAAIAYEYVRCEGVHSFWAVDVNFGDVTYQGKESPKISYDLLAPAYVSVINNISSHCLKTMKWPWEINA